MEWQIIVALVFAIPVILVPVAFIWYLNAGGLLAALRVARKRRATRKEGVVATETESK